MNSTLLKPKQVAEMLNVSQMTVSRMGKTGKLKKIVICENCVRYPLDEVLKIKNGGESV